MGNNDVSHFSDHPVVGMLPLLPRAGVIFPLNGGSDTRRDAREYHEQRATAMRLECRSWPCQVIYGGARRRTRGWRYLHWREGNCRVWGWMPWRKAKRRLRRKTAAVV